MRDDILDEDGNVRVSKLIAPGFQPAMFWNCSERYRVIEGARGTGKSVSMYYDAVLKIMSNPFRNVVFVRRVDVSNRESTFSGVRRAITDLGVDESFSIDKTNMVITYTPTGQVILFKGFNNPERLHSLTTVTGKLTDSYIEEAFEIDNWDDVRNFDRGFRGKLPKGCFYQTTFMFNPWNINTWLYTEFFKGHLDTGPEEFAYLDDPSHAYRDYRDPDWQGPQGKGLYIHQSTYKINPWLDEGYGDSAMHYRQLSPDIYKTEYLGIWGNATSGTYGDEFSDDRCVISLQQLKERFKFNSFAIGIDTGLSNGEGGRRTVLKGQKPEERIKSATVMTLVGVTDDSENIVVIDEYYHTEISRNFDYNSDEDPDDKNRQLGQAGLTRACVETLIKWIKKYGGEGIGLLDGATIHMFVDSADLGFQQGLYQEVQVNEWLSYNARALVHPSTKLSTQSRVDFEKIMMSWGNFLVVDQCKNVIREIKNARRDKSGRPREDNDDHALTSMEYGFTPLLPDVARWKRFKGRGGPAEPGPTEIVMFE